MALPSNVDNDKGEGDSVRNNSDTVEGKARPKAIPIIYLIIGAIAVATFFAGYFAAYFQQPGYKEGYEQGYSIGYVSGAEDVFNFNTLPDRWITLDAKSGTAFVNGTDVVFTWRETDNQTQVLAFQSTISFAPGSVDSTLYLMSDPIDLPQDVAEKTGLHPSVHYVLTDGENNTYVLKRLGES